MKTFISVTIQNATGKTSNTLTLPESCGKLFEGTIDRVRNIGTVQEFDTFIGVVVDNNLCSELDRNKLNTLFDWTELSAKCGFKVQVAIRMV